MSELVANCPRCGSRQITFDLTQAHLFAVEYNWRRVYEAFCICRHCKRATVFVLAQERIEDRQFFEGEMLVKSNTAINRYLEITGFINLKDIASAPPPEHLPKEIEAAFKEGATCVSVGCYNAAGTMFRLCVDLATRTLLPQEDTHGLNAKIRRDLGLRLPWLFDHDYLPTSLRKLSSCIKDDGNDGAHAGSLKKEDAEDLLDFTVALLERMYTEPKRLELAQERRDARRGKS